MYETDRLVGNRPQKKGYQFPNHLSEQYFLMKDQRTRPRNSLVLSCHQPHVVTQEEMIPPAKARYAQTRTFDYFGQVSR